MPLDVEITVGGVQRDETVAVAIEREVPAKRRKTMKR